MMKLKSTISREDLKMLDSASTQELGVTDSNKDTAIFLVSMVNMLFELVQEPVN